MWGGPPPSGYYPPPTGAPLSPYYAPAYPTAAAPYGGYPPPGGQDLPLSFPSPGDPYGTGGGVVPSLDASFGGLSLSYAQPPPPMMAATTAYHPSYSSSSCGGPPPASCGSGGVSLGSSCSSYTPPSSCGYTPPSTVLPAASSDPYYGGYASAPSVYYSTPHAAPAYFSSQPSQPQPQPQPPSSPYGMGGTHYQPAYSSGPSTYSPAPPIYGSAPPPASAGPSPYGAPPQPYMSGPVPQVPHMQPASPTPQAAPPSPYASGPAPYYPTAGVQQPQPHHIIPGMPPPSGPAPSLTLTPSSPSPPPSLSSVSSRHSLRFDAYCSTADCYGPSSGSFVPFRQISPAPTAPPVQPIASSVSYPQLPHAAPSTSSSSSPSPSSVGHTGLSQSGSVATVTNSPALPPSLRRSSTTSALEMTRHREREREQETERQLERERNAIVGNITTLPQRYQNAVSQMSVKDLKALQEQFGSLMVVGADTKIPMNDFASRTGFRPDSTLVRFLFCMFDVDKNGYITEVDFLCSMAFLMKGAKREKLEWVFEALDSNGDGIIDEMELNDVVLSMYQALSSLGITIPMTSLVPFLTDIFAAVPTNRSGKLHQTMTKEQYVTLGETQPRLLQGLGLLSCEGAEKRVGKRGTPVSLIGSSWKTCFYLMLGLRISLQMAKDNLTGEPSTTDFKTVSTFELVKTDMTKAETWTFTDYAPLVFKRFRAMCGVDETEYLLSLGPEQVLGNLLRGELSTPSVQLSDGKSGSFFYYSHDGRFLVKTIPLDECTSLFQILQGYYEHFQRYPDSLIGRFFGLHKINQTAFVVMENVFQTNIPIHRVYDLKGSTVNRSSGQGGGVQKDMDLNHLFFFDAEMRNKLVSQLHKDSDFLRERNLMDYSLLMGVHCLNFPDIECRPIDPSVKPKVPGEDLVPVEENAPFFRRNYGGLQARKKDGTPLSEIYFIGIIDILTTYSTYKSAENFVKSLFVNKHAISAVPPDEYSSRFKNYVTTIFE